MTHQSLPLIKSIFIIIQRNTINIIVKNIKLENCTTTLKTFFICNTVNWEDVLKISIIIIIIKTLKLILNTLQLIPRGAV